MTPAASTEMQISLLSPLLPSAERGEAAVPAATSLQFDFILDELLRLRSLPKDWDGQSSEGLDPRNVDRAIDWVRDMRRWRRAVPPTAAVPGTSGEIVLEWRGEGLYLAAEISDGEHVAWLLSYPGQEIRQWETDLRPTWIVCAENGRRP